MIREPDFEAIESAAQRIKGIANKTPVITSRTVNKLAGANIHFKCENFQRTGSFKFRGAYNAIANMTTEERHYGVLTFSSGNHAQGIALAGKILVTPTTIVMPNDAIPNKITATKEYGAEVILFNRNEMTREELGLQIAKDRDMIIIPPYDHPDIIAGQGTAALELFSEEPKLDYLLVPVGGGGLLSGSSLSAEALNPECKIIGVEPAAADDATRSFKEKELHCVENPETVADGARTPSLGKELVWPIVQRLVHDIITVTEEEIIEATLFIWKRMKLVVEPTGALAFAAILSGKINKPKANIGIILSGGNIDLETFYSSMNLKKDSAENE